jgi:hypothetical protein
MILTLKNTKAKLIYDHYIMMLFGALSKENDRLLFQAKLGHIGNSVDNCSLQMID